LLTKLYLQNFKGFDGRIHALSLAPLTFLVGPNSCGKSSVIQSLLLLCQSQRYQYDFPIPRTLTTSGSIVDLGSFESLVHDHAKDSTMSTGLRFTSRDAWFETIASYSRESVSDQTGASRATLEALEFRHGQTTNSVRTLLHLRSIAASQAADSTEDGNAFTFEDEEVDNLIEGVMSAPELKKRGAEPKILALCHALIHGNKTPVSSNFYKPRKDDPGPTKVEHLTAPGTTRAMPTVVLGSNNGGFRLTGGEILADVLILQDLKDLPAESTVDEEHFSRLAAEAAAVVAIFTKAIEHLVDDRAVPHLDIAARAIESVLHIGPFRERPRRFISLQPANSLFVGNTGRNLLYPLSSNTHLIPSVNKWFERLEIPYSIDIFGSGDDVTGYRHSLGFTLKKTPPVKVTMADVGFGLSQVMPVIVQLLIAREVAEESILCIEEPEIHLHPRMQANLGDLFIYHIKDHPNGKENQLLIETHSELAILRVQRRIREGTLAHDQVIILFVDKDIVGNSYVKEIGFDKRGSFTAKWPQGFFEERSAELWADPPKKPDSEDRHQS